MTEQGYAVRFPALAAKVLDTLPEDVEDTVWDVRDAAAGPWAFATRASASCLSPTG